MTEYIERGAVHRMIVGLQRYVWSSPISPETRVTVAAADANFELDKIPAADVAPVVHGQWLGTPIGFYEVLKCSVCGESSPTAGIMPKFCPNCGARMSHDKESEA